MIALSDLETWKRNFGLLPIRLRPLEEDFNFVMLNGGYGDFCLQTQNDQSDTIEYFSKSWSSNTKNFVVIEQENVKIFNWSKNSPEVIPQSAVVNSLDKFYSYLLQKSYKSDKDVVPFIIDLFRQLRNITLEKTNPVEALNLLFVLLTSLQEDYNNLDFQKWSINNINIPDNFQFFRDKINAGIDNIKPDLELIIRHSAGVLFQEAQKEVLFFDPQRDLFGGVSNKIKTSDKLYSSIHYTPPYLARTIVENSLHLVDLKKEKLKIFDPACGSSEFLIEVLKQLKEYQYSGEVEILGWDSSETAINTSNFLLKYEQRNTWKEKLKYEAIMVGDSLTEHWSNDYDLILMNPPFVSWELMTDKDTRDAVKEVLGSKVDKPNQACAFFYKATQSLNDQGVLGSVLPSNILTLEAYRKLRGEIEELITLNLVGKLGNFVFEDALADISIIVAQKPKTNLIPTIIWTKNEKGIAQVALRDLRRIYYSKELTVSENDYSVYQPTIFPIIKDSWKPISIQENDIFKTLERFVIEKRLVRIEDIFAVQPGIRQGAKDIFKITKQDFQELPEQERKYFKPAIDNDAIKNGELFDKKYIWFPYTSKGIIFKTEEELSNSANYFYNNVLKPNEEILTKRQGISEWWGLARARNWQYVQSPRLISKEFGNCDSFAFDQKGKFVVERGYAWTPKKDFSDTDDYYFYLTLFSSPFFNKLLSIYSSKQLAGGKWYDLGKKHTRYLPVPNVHSSEVKDSEAYRVLVDLGKELSKGNIYIQGAFDELLLKFFYPI